MNIKCEYCGKDRPFHPFGGVGPCDCEASKRARHAEDIRIRQEAATKAIEEYRNFHLKAISCDHEFEGCCSPAYTYCRKCGISLGQYYLYRDNAGITK